MGKKKRKVLKHRRIIVFRSSSSSSNSDNSSIRILNRRINYLNHYNRNINNGLESRNCVLFVMVPELKQPGWSGENWKPPRKKFKAVEHTLIHLLECMRHLKRKFEPVRKNTEDNNNRTRNLKNDRN